VDRLCGARDQVANGLEIESSLLGSRGTLEQVVAAKSAEGLMMGWQKELMKEPLSWVQSGAGI
jgi:ribonuclease D